MLSVPASTLRRWAIRFEKALSPQDMEAGRHRVYANSDLEVFRQIRDLAAKGHSLRSIENILTVIPPGQAKPEFTPNFEPVNEPTPDNETAPNSALMIGFCVLRKHWKKQGQRPESAKPHLRNEWA